jgi:tRNA-Thr(GGU) m(6)t(6)A37 methyltransferase TsaA
MTSSDSAPGQGPTLQVIGRVESPLTDPAAAPKQADDTAPAAWLIFLPAVHEGLGDIAVGDTLIVVTWLHLAQRDVLRVHPQDRLELPLRGVFSTRSADRPNPLGLHPVRVVALAAGRIGVDRLEAVDGTPIVDLKPTL